MIRKKISGQLLNLSKVPGYFGYLLYIPIDYEIHNNVLYRSGLYSCFWAIKQETGIRKMFIAGLFRN